MTKAILHSIFEKPVEEHAGAIDELLKEKGIAPDQPIRDNSHKLIIKGLFKTLFSHTVYKDSFNKIFTDEQTVCTHAASALVEKEGSTAKNAILEAFAIASLSEEEGKTKLQETAKQHELREFKLMKVFNATQASPDKQDTLIADYLKDIQPSASRNHKKQVRTSLKTFLSQAIYHTPFAKLEYGHENYNNVTKAISVLVELLPEEAIKQAFAIASSADKIQALKAKAAEYKGERAGIKRSAIIDIAPEVRPAATNGLEASGCAGAAMAAGSAGPAAPAEQHLPKRRRTDYPPDKPINAAATATPMDVAPPQSSRRAGITDIANSEVTQTKPRTPLEILADQAAKAQRSR